jgi:hypothetical protein
MLWVTRRKPHVDRCASAWLIKRFIDKSAVFQFIDKDTRIPKGAIGFTLAKAKINPVEGVKTTFDALLEKYDVKDPAVLKIKEIVRDYEFNKGGAGRIRLKETLGLCHVLKGLEKVSGSDSETVHRAIFVLDAFYAIVKEARE